MIPLSRYFKRFSRLYASRTKNNIVTVLITYQICICIFFFLSNFPSKLHRRNRNVSSHVTFANETAEDVHERAFQFSDEIS